MILNVHNRQQSCIWTVSALNLQMSCYAFAEGVEVSKVLMQVTRSLHTAGECLGFH